jgi:hypothetical protein
MTEKTRIPAVVLEFRLRMLVIGVALLAGSFWQSFCQRFKGQKNSARDTHSPRRSPDRNDYFLRFSLTPTSNGNPYRYATAVL